MAGSKRSRNDENNPLVFLQPYTSGPKRTRRIAQSISLPDIQNLQTERAKRDAELTASVHQSLEKSNEEKKAAEVKFRVQQVLNSVSAAGYQSLFGFVDELLHIRDQQISSQVSRMLGRHCGEVLGSIRARQPSLVNEWALGISGEILAQEGELLAEYLRPIQGSQLKDVACK